MSKQSIKQTIDDNIYQNGEQRITGVVMNSVLNAMVDNEYEELNQLSSRVDELDETINGSDGRIIIIADGGVSEAVPIETIPKGTYNAHCTIGGGNLSAILRVYQGIPDANPTFVRGEYISDHWAETSTRRAGTFILAEGITKISAKSGYLIALYGNNEGYGYPTTNLPGQGTFKESYNVSTSYTWIRISVKKADDTAFDSANPTDLVDVSYGGEAIVSTYPITTSMETLSINWDADRMDLYFGASNTATNFKLILRDASLPYVNGLVNDLDDVKNEMLSKQDKLTSSTRLGTINGVDFNFGGNINVGGSGIQANELVYVNAVSGADTNDGSASAPYKTFAKALQSTGQDTTIIFEGDTTERLNIKTKSNQRSIRLIGKEGKRNRIIRGTIVNSATNVSGNVYSKNLSSFRTTTFYIFQLDIVDSTTLITDDERHPLQKGREYRCDSVRLSRAASLEEVQSAEVQSYYWDATAKVLYFKIANGSNLTDNPIVIPENTSAISGNDGSVKIEVSNMEFYCGSVLLNYCHDAIISDCKAFGVYGDGGFRYDNSVNISFIRCEAARTFTASGTGDGFNGHSNHEESYDSNDPMAKHTSVSLIDCWSHDNNDDGYSDHERCECIVRGGLYEYNHKGGVTPSYGSHCVCYDVLSRKNYNGFYYIGESSDGGKYGQMMCYNCVAKDNSQRGFRVSSNNNSAMLYNCLAIDNTLSNYYAEASSTKMTLYNCTSVGDVAKAGSGQYTIINGTSLE